MSLTKIHTGEIYALEPFVTVREAYGAVEDAPMKTIFRLVKPKAGKSAYAKQLIKYIEENFFTLPFAERWIQNVVPQEKYKDAFKELITTKAIMSYPVLVEVSRKTVAQAEHTIIVKEDGCTVLT